MNSNSKWTKSILAGTAVLAVAMPLIAGAGTGSNGTEAVVVPYDKSSLNDARAMQELYVRLKVESRRLCGSSNLQITGSVARSMANEECYEGTLTAAVRRLDNPGVTALHEAES